MGRIVHRPPPPHAVIGPGRDRSPVEITHLSQQIQVLYTLFKFCANTLNHLVLHLKKVPLKMLLCLNQQLQRHNWRWSVNLLQHPLWPSALIVVLLTSSSIRRVFFVGCRNCIILVFSCVYTRRLEYVTS